ESVNLVRILRSTLGDAGSQHHDLDLLLAGQRCSVHWEKGDRKWPGNFAVRTPRPPAEPDAKPQQAELFDFGETATFPPAQPAPSIGSPRQRPAEAGASRVAAGTLFTASRLESRARGDLLHQALARVEWLEPDTLQNLEAWWRAQGGTLEDFGILRRCLT